MRSFYPVVQDGENPTGMVRKAGQWRLKWDSSHSPVVLVHEGSLDKVYYLGGRVESRPPNKEIYSDGTAGSVTDPKFVDWSNSYYGTAVKAVARNSQASPAAVLRNLSADPPKRDAAVVTTVPSQIKQITTADVNPDESVDAP